MYLSQNNNLRTSNKAYNCRLCGHRVKANEFHMHESQFYQTQLDNANSGKYRISKKEQREQAHQRQLQRERQYINGHGQIGILGIASLSIEIGQDLNGE
jgi:hypothetical protein